MSEIEPSEVDWPDAGAWLSRLQEKLLIAEERYLAFRAIERGEIDPSTFGNPDLEVTAPIDGARLQLGAAIGAVLRSLRELPAFADRRGLIPLQDLVAAIKTLDNGSREAVLEPRKRDEEAPSQAPISKRRAAREYVQVHALACVEIVKAAGVTRAKAREIVAGVFAQAGFRGRKKKHGVLEPLSPKTLYEWEGDVAGEENGGRKRQLVRILTRYKADPAWPPSIELAMAEVERVANHPVMTSKI